MGLSRFVDVGFIGAGTALAHQLDAHDPLFVQETER